MLHEKWFAIMPIAVVLSFAAPAFADSVEDHIRDLNDENSTVRALAAEALGELKDVRAVEPLIEALNDTDVFVQESAAQALRSIEEVKGIDPVMNVLKLKDADTHVRVELYGLLREEVNGAASCESIDLLKLKKMNDTGYKEYYVDAEGL